MEAAQKPEPKENKFTQISIRVLLTIIPLIVCAYSIYYLVLVAESIFIKSIGASSAVIAAFLGIVALVSCATAFVGLKDYDPILPTTKFHVYLVSTLVGFILCITILIYTSMSSQSTYEQRIKQYLFINPNDQTTHQFQNKYLTAFSQLQYYFNIGENSNEVFIILTVIWVLAFIAFFVVSEIDEP